MGRAYDKESGSGTRRNSANSGRRMIPGEEEVVLIIKETVLVVERGVVLVA